MKLNSTSTSGMNFEFNSTATKGQVLDMHLFLLKNFVFFCNF
jgi:hypothetical protein